jgi:hypothetical protein
MKVPGPAIPAPPRWIWALLLIAAWIGAAVHIDQPHKPQPYDPNPLSGENFNAAMAGDRCIGRPTLEEYKACQAR